MRKIIIVIAVVALIALIFAIGVIIAREDTGTVAGSVVDALGNSPVYKAKITIDGKTTMRYADKEFRLTGIPPGSHTLTIEAPAYERFEKEITVKNGLNLIQEVKMKGTEIADLKKVSLSAEPIRGEGIEFEIRFINSKSEEILYYPRLKMTLEAKLHQRVGDKDDYTLGKLLYQGPVELYWNPLGGPGKNRGLIPRKEIDFEPGFGKYGVLEGVLRTPQGDFKAVASDVSLDYGY